MEKFSKSGFDIHNSNGNATGANNEYSGNIQLKKWFVIFFLASCSAHIQKSAAHAFEIIDANGKEIMATNNEDSSYILAGNYWFKNHKTVFVLRVQDSAWLYGCGMFNMYNPELEKIDSSTIN